MRPHKFIFNRVWYEELGGKPEFEEYQAKLRVLSASEKAELLCLLRSFENSKFEFLLTQTNNQKVAEILSFYRPLNDAQEADIRESQKRMRAKMQNDVTVPDDERVEDAGLELEPLLEVN